MKRLAALSISILCASCNTDPQSQSIQRAHTASKDARSGSGHPTDLREDCAVKHASLLTTAELFERISEDALSGSRNKAGHELQRARSTVQQIDPLVPKQTNQNIRVQLDTMAAAHKSGDWIDLALASMDIYRMLVSAAATRPAIPLDVSLMEYAGIRYAAAAQLNPPHWEDMTHAAAFARQHWALLELNGFPNPLSDGVASVLDDMDSAAAAHDRYLAVKSAARELALVDKLEAALKQNRRTLKYQFEFRAHSQCS